MLPSETSLPSPFPFPVPSSSGRPQTARRRREPEGLPAAKRRRAPHRKPPRWQDAARLLIFSLPLVFFIGCSAEQRAAAAEDRIAEYRRHPSERTKQAAAEALAALHEAIRRREKETLKGNQTPKETAELAKLELRCTQLDLEFAKAKVDAFVNGVQRAFEDR
ncbi:MAG: hypothetical protein AB7T14_09055 [Candidatus Methylacidiphilaceae bacterium]